MTEISIVHCYAPSDSFNYYVQEAFYEYLNAVQARFSKGPLRLVSSQLAREF